VIQQNYTGSSNEVVLNRRIYRLMNNAKENNFFLVHYLKEPSTAAQSTKLSARSEFTEDKNTQETRSIPPAFSPFNYKYNNL